MVPVVAAVLAARDMVGGSAEVVTWGGGLVDGFDGGSVRVGR
jgi:hypothetical protein